MTLLALDFIIIAVLLVSATLSLIRGFTKEVLSVAGWVISGYMAIFWGPLLKPFIAPYVTIDWVVNIGAMLIVFLISLVVFSLLANAISKTLKLSGIGMLDRSLGVLFGLTRGLFIIALGYFVTVLVLPEDKHPDWIKNARLRPMLQTSTKLLVSIVPLDRLPLNIANIEGLMRNVPTKALRDALDNELKGDPQKRDNIQDTEDKTDYNKSGYKQSERNSMERLIRNSERLE